MLNAKQSDLITRTGPGTPGGKLMRHYWQPVAVLADLPVDGSPLAVDVLGEPLVLFRDEQGRIGLLNRHCPHRGTDLSYGRVEHGGLRCVYHGWLFDVHGQCLQQPAEPANTRMTKHLRHRSYPVHIAGGAIFAYMGEGPAPLFPDYEFLRATDDYLLTHKVLVECNYLQASEGNYDPAHLSFLHRFLSSQDEFMDSFAEHVRPDLSYQRTDYGVRIFSVRPAPDGMKYVRVTNFMMPNKSAIAGEETHYGAEGYTVMWHVPIDDYSHWRYEWNFHRKTPIDKEWWRKHRTGQYTPDQRYQRNARNRYMQDRAQQRTQNFTGMGRYFPAQDAFAVESQGAIQDRSQEHLGTTDLVIVEVRKMLLEAIAAIEKGEDPPHVVRQPADNGFPNLLIISELVQEGTDLRQFCETRAREVAQKWAAEARSLSA